MADPSSVPGATLTAHERSTVVAVVEGIQRRNRRRHRAARTGWALLATAGISLPVIAGALDQSIALTTALVRIGLALALCLFVATVIGTMIDTYQTQAALGSVEDALLTARAVASDPTADSTDDDHVDH